MIDCRQRKAMYESKRLGGNQPNQQPANETGACSCRNALQIFETEACFLQASADQNIQDLDMGARSNFRDHPAIRLMVLELRPHNIREDRSSAVGAHSNDGGSGLIA